MHSGTDAEPKRAVRTLNGHGTANGTHSQGAQVEWRQEQNAHLRGHSMGARGSSETERRLCFQCDTVTGNLIL